MQFQICRHTGFLDSVQHHTLVTLSGGTVTLYMNTAKLSVRCSKAFPWSRKSSSSRATLEILRACGLDFRVQPLLLQQEMRS